MDRIELEDLLHERLSDLMPHLRLDLSDEGELVIFTSLTEDSESDEIVDFESEHHFDEDEGLSDIED